MIKNECIWRRGTQAAPNHTQGGAGHSYHSEGPWHSGTISFAILIFVLKHYKTIITIVAEIEKDTSAKLALSDLEKINELTNTYESLVEHYNLNTRLYARQFES